MSRRQLIATAKQEIKAWGHSGKLPEPLVMAILFAFVHRVTTGETVEETFFSKSPPIVDYEI